MSDIQKARDLTRNLMTWAAAAPKSASNVMQEAAACILDLAAEIERLRAELAECRAEMAERDGAGLGERGA